MAGDEAETLMPSDGRALAAILVIFLRLGLTGFGGAERQVARLRRDLVDRRAWLSDADFAACAEAALWLPGSTGLQVAIAVGRIRGGVAGGAAAALGYLAPAGLAAIALGVFWLRLEDIAGGAWLHGAKAACAAIVLQAVLDLRRTYAREPIRLGLAIGAAIGLALVAGAAAQLAALCVGAFFGFALLREAGAAPPAPATRESLAPLAVFAGLLVILPLAAALLLSPHLGLAGAAFRAGAFALGDGRLILPLIEAETQGRGWLGAERAVAGFGLVSALPGPAIAYAGFIGAVQDYTGAGVRPGGWLGGLAALTAASVPAVLLGLAAAPARRLLATSSGLKAALAGMAATGVGVLAACLWRTVLPSAVVRPTDWALVAAAWVFIAVARLPAWATVLGFAAATAVFNR